eukprot:scaffold282341_cov26-Tisochrysis_lutea.AAC.3
MRYPENGWLQDHQLTSVQNIQSRKSASATSAVSGSSSVLAVDPLSAGGAPALECGSKELAEVVLAQVDSVAVKRCLGPRVVRPTEARLTKMAARRLHGVLKCDAVLGDATVVGSRLGGARRGRRSQEVERAHARALHPIDRDQHVARGLEELRLALHVRLLDALGELRGDAADLKAARRYVFGAHARRERRARVAALGEPASAAAVASGVRALCLSHGVGTLDAIPPVAHTVV